MAVNDLTGQQIQNTYQRVIQTDGTLIADGTGSELPIKFDGPDLIVSGALRAQSYIVSQSVINVSSGSTVFGNSSDDIHTFIGDVTASGNISSSNFHLPVTGYISAPLASSPTSIQFVDSQIVFKANTEQFKMTSGIGVVFNDSGNVSNDFRVESETNPYAFFVDAGANKVAIGTSTVGDSLLTVNGTITATAITSSGQILTTGITSSGIAGTGPTTGLHIDGFLSASIATLTGLLNQGSEATAVMINGSNVVGTRELGLNAFTNTTIGTTTNALTVDNATLQLNSGTTFNGSAARTISIKDGGVDNDALGADAVDGTKIADDAIDSDHIADDQVTYAKIQNVTQTDVLLGRDSTGAGVIEEITPANVKTMLGLGTAATTAATAYATSAQGTKADSAQQPPSEGAFANGDKTKLDAIEASADVTDATNVAAAGALMDSDLIDEDTMSTNSATRPPSQQSVKAYVDAQPIVLTSQAVYLGTPNRNEITLGNTNYGWDSDTIGSLVKVDTSPAAITITRNSSHGGIVIPFNITNLNFKCAYRPAQTKDSSNSGIDRPYSSKAAGADFNSGEQSTFTVRFYVGDRADDSNANIDLVQVGSDLSDIPNNNKHFFNLDLGSPITSFVGGANFIEAGKLLFIGFEFTNENAHSDLDEFQNGHIKITYTLSATPA